MSEPLWTAQQVADLLGLSRQWVYQMAREHQLPYVRLGSAMRFRPADIRAWVDSRAVKVQR